MQRSVSLGMSVVCVIALLSIEVAAIGSQVIEPSGTLQIKADGDKPVSSFALIFDLKSIPTDESVDYAELTIVVDADSLLGGNLLVHVHAALGEWSPDVRARDETIAVDDSLLATRFSKSGESQSIRIDVTELVKLWHDTKLSNNGFHISVRGNTDRKFMIKENGAGVEASLQVYYSK